MWADAILILVISICTAFLGEGLTWLLVYRTEKYQRLKADIERQTKKLEKKKEAHGDSTLDRTQKRKMEREEERLKSTNRDLMMVRMGDIVEKTSQAGSYQVVHMECYCCTTNNSCYY